MKQASLALLCIFLLLSCSQDDEFVKADFRFPDFTVVSFDEDSFYTYTFSEASQSGLELNSTTQEAVPRQVAFVHRNPPVYGFYTIGNAVIKNFETGVVQTVGDFGVESSDEIRITARNDARTLALIYTFDNTTEKFLRVIDVVSNARYVLDLGATSDNVVLYVDKGLLYLLEPESSGSRLRVYSVAQSALVAERTLDENVFELVFGDQNNFYAFDFSGGFAQFEIDTFTKISEGATSFIPENNRNVKVIDGILYGQFAYPQPSFYDVGPASYDLSGGEASIIDIQEIFDVYLLNNEIIAAIEPTYFDYSPEKEVWLLTYVATLKDDTQSFGVFAIDSNQEIVGEVFLARAPWTVITK